jgi:hypothetical protein
MAKFRLLKSEVKPLTRELAEHFRDLEPSPTERDLNPARLKYLQEQAEAGLLITFNWARAKMEGKTLRVNGQHSSNVLCGLNGEFPQGLFAHIDDYEVDGPEGLAVLFRQFDQRKSARSSADVAGAYQNLHPELHQVAKPIGKLGIDAITWHRRTIEGAPTESGDAVYTAFGTVGNHPFLLWLSDVFSIKTPELKKTQIVAAMYATFIKNADEARKFWDQVARGGIEYEDNAPATVLDGWLKAIKEGEIKTELKPAQYYQGCIWAWNAFREEKEIKDIKCDTRKSWYTPHE